MCCHLIKRTWPLQSHFWNWKAAFWSLWLETFVAFFVFLIWACTVCGTWSLRSFVRFCQINGVRMRKDTSSKLFIVNDLNTDWIFGVLWCYFLFWMEKILHTVSYSECSTFEPKLQFHWNWLQNLLLILIVCYFYFMNGYYSECFSHVIPWFFARWVDQLFIVFQFQWIQNSMYKTFGWDCFGALILIYWNLTLNWE